MENRTDQLIDELSLLFEENVPLRGKAKTTFGEIVRALNKIAYRFYNDGDRASVGYGKKTVDPSLAYLYKVYPHASHFIEELFTVGSYDEYEEALTELLEVFVKELKSNKSKYENISNKEDCISFDTEELYNHLDSLGIQININDEDDYYDFYEDEEEDEE